MRYIHAVIVGLVLLASSCSPIEERPAHIAPCAPMPGARTAAVAFAIGDRAYVWGGRDEHGRLSNTLYCYDAKEDRWTSLGTTPLSPRVSATAAVVGSKAYIGLGFSQGIYRDSAYLRDWWSFDPATQTWDSLAPYPATNTVGGISYVEDNAVYYAYGFSTGFGSTVYQYDTQTNHWSELVQQHTRMLSVMAPSGCSLKGRHFIGSGYRTADQDSWYEIHWQEPWSECAPIPGARSMAVSAAGTDCIYLAGGRAFHGEMSGGKVYDDILRYDVKTNTWTLAGRLPTGAEHMIGFTLGGKTYIGLGENRDGAILNTLYRIDE